MQNGTKLLILISIAMGSLLSCNLIGSKDGGPDLSYFTFSTPHTHSVEGYSRKIPLNVKAFDEDSLLIPNLDYDIFINGENQGKLTSFSSELAGEYLMYASYDGIVSDTLRIKVRPEKEFPSKEFQIIFHIVHDGEPVGTNLNIPSEIIDREMEKVEYVFSNPEISLTPNSSFPNMSFILATEDPNGNSLAEPGINRVQRPSEEHSILFEDWMWDIYWDPDYYINVWVGETKNEYSYGVYPRVNCETEMEGISCSDATTPRHLEGVALNASNLSEHNWVLPHEIGHVFGLFHIFNYECGDDPDFVTDTNFYSRSEYENGPVTVTRIDCSGAVFTSYNIMDYWSQPIAGRDLSYDQRERVRTIVELGRFRGQKDLSDGIPRDMSQFKPDNPAKMNSRIIY